MRGFVRKGLHPSLRLKLTLAFTAAMAALLTGLGLFIYGRWQAGLDKSLEEGLRGRARDVAALVKQADHGLAEGGGASLSRDGTGFAQVLRQDGKVLDATPGLPVTPLLARRDIARVGSRALFVTAQIPGLAGRVRLLATRIGAQDTSLVVVVGVSLESRAVALRDLRDVMLLGGPIALLLAAFLGYVLASTSLGSMEAMRREATRLSVARPGGRLPVPAARDELHRLAVTLNEMLERNEVAFARERRFVADASHELRSPLTVLKAELELALTGQGSEQELRRAVESANIEADRVVHVAQDMLTLAQADDGALRIEPTTVRVPELLQRVNQRFLQRAAAERRLLVASAPDGLTVDADPLRLEQAVSNLLDNALRHSAGPVTLSAEQRHGSVELHVTDRGHGFPADFLNVAFERFSRPDTGRTADGTGLGLSIVRSIARAHGGEAHVSNRPGGGADAWIALPAAANGVRAAPSRSPEAGVAGREPARVP